MASAKDELLVTTTSPDTGKLHHSESTHVKQDHEISVSYLMAQCMMLGFPHVGKTSIYNRLVDNNLPPGQTSSQESPSTTDVCAKIEAGKLTKMITVNDNGRWEEVESLSKGISSDTEEQSIIFVTNVMALPEFQEVLPTLVAGPTVFTLVFSLHDERHDPLNKLCKETYKFSTEDSENYVSCFTVQEILMQCLSSIAAYKRIQSHNYSKISGVDSDPPPVSVMILATHLDLVSSEVATSVNRTLQDSLATTDLEKTGVIEELDCSKGQLIIPIDSSHNDDIKSVKDVFERIVTRKKGKESPFRIKLPAHWLDLKFYLKSVETSTVSYTDCLKQAQERYGISAEDLPECLRYLHYKTGCIRYYENVAELKDVIITKPNILLEAVARFITSTFTTNKVKGNVEKKFKQYGLFKTKEVECVFNSQKRDIQISFDQFVALLKHLNILCTSYDTDYDYFLPCALARAPEADDQQVKTCNMSDPLLVLFENGFVLKGVFSGLLAFFIHEKWRIRKRRSQPMLYRYEAVLNADDDNTRIKIKSKATCLEFHVTGQGNSIVKPQNYLKVKKTVVKAMNDVCEKLGYDCTDQTWLFGFYCHCGDEDCKESTPHIAIFDEETYKYTCPVTEDRYSLLSNTRKAWFLPSEENPSEVEKMKQCLMNDLNLDNTAVTNKADQLQPPNDLIENTEAGQVKPAAGVDNTKLPEGEFIQVMRATYSITDWSMIAVLLGISTADFERIRKDHANNARHQHRAIVKKWLSLGKASWAILVSALRDSLVEELSVADEIAKAHPS